MRDQFNQLVPADLVVIPDFWLLTEEQVKIVDKMDWYECRGVLLISQSDLGGNAVTQ